MEEGCFGKRENLWSSSPSSSSLLWGSRLSPLAQPFTMKRQTSEPQSSLTSSPSNKLHAFDDLVLPNLIDFDLPACSSPESSLSASAFPFDGRKPREFADDASFSQLSLGFGDETGLDGFSFENKSSHGRRTAEKRKGVVSSVALARESLINHDPVKISAATDSSSLPMSQKRNTLRVPALGSEVKSLEHKGNKNIDAKAVCSKVADFSLKSYPKKLDDEEDDLDSPCWKGFQNRGKSPSSKPLPNESEAGPTLNPKAPQFFPSNGKRTINFSQNNAIGEASSSLNASSQDQKLKDPCNDIGYQYSNGIHKPVEKAFMLESSKIENSSSSGLGSINEFSQIVQCLSSISRSPNMNASMAVKAMHYLSDLLVQNCNYDALNGNELEMVHNTIDNLYLFINSRAGKKTPMLTLPPTSHLVYRDKAYERPNMEKQITRSRDLVVRDELDSWRNSNLVNGYSQASTWKTQDPDSLYRDTGSSYRDNNINPALRTALKENGPTSKDFQPQALLNLWIEAQAALCSMKYENNILRMKLGVHSEQ